MLECSSISLHAISIMSGMNDGFCCFLTLVKAGLSSQLDEETILRLKSADLYWNDVFSFAKEQSVLGLVVDGIAVLPTECRPPQALYLQACAFAVKIEQSNRKLNKQSVSIFQLFGEHGIVATLMKGQGVALNYPNPLRRQCGDIDIYVGSDAYNKTNELMESLGAEAEGDEIIKHKSWFWEGVEIEVHKEMAVLSKPSHYRYFKKLLKDWFPNKLESVEIENTTIAVAPAQFDAIFLLVHILEHLLREGIGLRQPLDWLLFIDRHKDQLDRKQLEIDLKKTGLLELAASLIGVGSKYLGFVQLKGVLQYQVSDDNIDLLFNEIMQSGNFGVIDKQKKGDSANRAFIIRKTNSFMNISKRLMRMYPLAKEEASWFLWFTIKNGVYTRFRLMRQK